MQTAIVILNWNGIKFLKEFLPILYKNTPQTNAEIIIADNGSTDGSVEWLQESFPQIRTILFSENHGFTGGYNLALSQVEADYFILLNSDIRVPEIKDGKNWLTPLVDFMENNREVAVCQPKILSESEPTQFEYAGAAGGFIDKYGFPFCRGRILSTVEQDNGQYDTPMEIFWATGACMMVRSNIWREVNGLDGGFFAHMEEIDMCWRIQRLGYQIWCVPQSLVYHVGGGTLPNNSPRKLLFNYRNNLLMLYKNLPIGRQKNRLIFKRMCIDGLSAIAYLLQGKVSYFKAVLRAHKEYKQMRKAYPKSELASSTDRLPKGVYEQSIILKYFTGNKLFSQLKF